MVGEEMSRRHSIMEYVAPADNQDPVIGLAQVVGQDGRQVALAVSATDDDADALSYRFDWGDGSEATVTNGGVASHTYADGEFRTYTVTVTVSDGRGGQDVTTFEFDFPAPAANQAPEFEVAQLIEKDGFDIALPSLPMIRTGMKSPIESDWGDNSPETVQQSGIARHSFPADVFQNYQITVTADDGRAGLDVATIAITFPAPAANQNPVFAHAQFVDRNGFAVVIDALADDPDGDVLSYTIDWGDGSDAIVQASGLAAHVYADNVYRPYTVTITADDGRGGTAQTTLQHEYVAPPEKRR